ncbi:MAG: histidine phosphatase family protein [Mycobacterium leprae]
MQLYLVRHGQSEGNVVTYDVPDGNLTALGQVQATEAGKRLMPEGIDLVIVSPLRRALQTAAAIARETGAPLEVWQELCEHRDNGLYRFMGKNGVRSVVADAVCEAEMPEDGFDFGLESPAEAHDRALRMLGRLRSRFAHTEKRVAVVAHGGFNAFFLMAMMGRPWQRGHWIEQNNCCVNRVWMDPEHVRLLSVNETAHLTQVT